MSREMRNGDLSAVDAEALDREDPLRDFRPQFEVADPQLVYLDGNSLGRLPSRTAERLERVVRAEWGERLIRAWNEGWLGLPYAVGRQIAALAGARDDEVVVADSTTVNLFKLATAALRHQSGRTEVVTDGENFPTDVHALRSAIEASGRSIALTIVPAGADGLPGCEALVNAISPRTALVCLSHVTYRSGYLYPMDEVTQAAHRQGAMVLWDLSHSVGAVRIALAEMSADLAVGCTYKYLCGGPGAPAFLYVRRDLQSKLHNAVGGWFGQDRPFDFSLDDQPAPGIRRFVTGTPPVLSLAAIADGVALVAAAGIDRVREKSVTQTEYLVSLFDRHLAPLGFTLRSPRDARRRGSHVALGHIEAWRIVQALVERHRVIPDFRRPDSVRLGVAPLSTTYTEIARAVNALRQVVVERQYESYAHAMEGAS